MVEVVREMEVGVVRRRAVVDLLRIRIRIAIDVGPASDRIAVLSECSVALWWRTDIAFVRNIRHSDEPIALYVAIRPAIEAVLRDLTYDSHSRDHVFGHSQIGILE